jgi:predicted transcriptional regulator
MTIAPTTEQDFAARMEKIGVTQSFLAGYVGLSQSAISKAVNELTDSQRTRINEALRELEEMSAFFAPMKPLFGDAAAVKEWLRSPALPNLFKLLTDAQLMQLNTQELTQLNAISLQGDRLEEKIEASEQRTQRLFLDWLENPSGK